MTLFENYYLYKINNNNIEHKYINNIFINEDKNKCNNDYQCITIYNETIKELDKTKILYIYIDDIMFLISINKDNVKKCKDIIAPTGTTMLNLALYDIINKNRDLLYKTLIFELCDASYIKYINGICKSVHDNQHISLGGYLLLKKNIRFYESLGYLHAFKEDKKEGGITPEYIFDNFNVIYKFRNNFANLKINDILDMGFSTSYDEYNKYLNPDNNPLLDKTFKLLFDKFKTYIHPFYNFLDSLMSFMFKHKIDDFQDIKLKDIITHTKALENDNIKYEFISLRNDVISSYNSIINNIELIFFNEEINIYNNTNYFINILLNCKTEKDIKYIIDTYFKFISDYGIKLLNDDLFNLIFENNINMHGLDIKSIFEKNFLSYELSSSLSNNQLPQLTGGTNNKLSKSKSSNRISSNSRKKLTKKKERKRTTTHKLSFNLYTFIKEKYGKHTSKLITYLKNNIKHIIIKNDNNSNKYLQDTISYYCDLYIFEMENEITYMMPPSSFTSSKILSKVRTNKTRTDKSRTNKTRTYKSRTNKTRTYKSRTNKTRSKISYRENLLV
jgi:hypothetical protein